LSNSWSFAEGATGFFHTYLLMGNPAPTATRATVTYYLADRTTLTKQYDVPAQSRRTVDINNEDPRLASTTFYIRMTTIVPIVAERAIWWGTPFYEGSVSLGIAKAAQVWAIAEAAEGGPTADATFVLIANGSTSGLVRLTVVYDDGSREQRDYPLLADARLTVRIADDFQASHGKRFSILVESLNPNMLLTVECSRYQSPTGFLDAGGTASATKVR
jgi:hypothetical protein